MQRLGGGQTRKVKSYYYSKRLKPTVLMYDVGLIRFTNPTENIYLLNFMHIGIGRDTLKLQ